MSKSLSAGCIGGFESTADNLKHPSDVSSVGELEDLNTSTSRKSHDNQKRVRCSQQCRLNENTST